MRMLRTLTLAAMTALAIPAAHAAPVNLSSWSALTLNFPGGQGAGNWALEPGNTAVQQTINADPSFFLNNSNNASYTMRGNWQVLPAGAGDDDYMGFVFGYQNSSNFYLFDWKQGSQSSGAQFAAEGMTVKKFTGATGNGLTDLSIGEFWENQVDFGDMDVLATNHSSTAGWLENILYTFQLDYNVTAGQFRIQVSNGATSLWDVTVNDTTFTGGQFGFYNNSQQAVRYAGFEETVIVPDPDPTPDPTPVPEPASLGLLGLALAGVGLARRRRK